MPEKTAVQILATATCGGRRLEPVVSFEGEGSDFSTTSITVARAAMAGARKQLLHPHYLSDEFCGCHGNRITPIDGTAAEPLQ
jgi:hypothetical protein